MCLVVCDFDHRGVGREVERWYQVERLELKNTI